MERVGLLHSVRVYVVSESILRLTLHADDPDDEEVSTPGM
jgi:hypothetical protein